MEAACGMVGGAFLVAEGGVAVAHAEDAHGTADLQLHLFAGRLQPLLQEADGPIAQRVPTVVIICLSNPPMNRLILRQANDFVDYPNCVRLPVAFDREVYLAKNIKNGASY